MTDESSPPVLHATGLTRRYGRRTALSHCDLRIPKGRVIGLVGPNGAGKSTLLQLACGLIRPTAGTLRVLGERPAADAAHLARVGYVAQDTPVYAGLTVADHLRMGGWLNPSWDAALAKRRIDRAGLHPAQRAGRLSGGQRAQLALTVAAGKRPELLILDEPAAALDPLARDAFLHQLMEFVAELGASVVLSSHLLGDVARVCDYLVVLAGGRVQLAGDVPDLLAGHRRLVASRGELDRLPAGMEPVRREAAGDRDRVLVRVGAGTPPLPGVGEPVGLEELVLGYLGRAAATGSGSADPSTGPSTGSAGQPEVRR
ncbi:ABC transporter ATP-binding protein [Micromonospora auratinigra]|uniref:ABC-2 type transport system ATP-binding protein n=1 Tax=Micromonospora auratinigra TaxID=261654 RepID=A0A1A8Z7A5_9ACTN|nr:ABC transporter ATP-binding protein [Micromonospora auratinigra]SBT39819.1 ABC-2 type transport system ATP-binding protein [Micromonospora auratinigra]